jgi:hypothetical protein
VVLRKGPLDTNEAYHVWCAADRFREPIVKSRRSWAELYAFEVDRALDAPVFRQIYLQLRSAILSGTLHTLVPANEFDGTGHCRLKGSEEARYQRPQIGQPIGLRLKHNDSYRKRCKVLLKGQVSIHRNEHIELSGCKGQQLSILDCCPAHLASSLDVVPDDLPAKRRSTHSSSRTFTRLLRSHGPSLP